MVRRSTVASILLFAASVSQTLAQMTAPNPFPDVVPSPTAPEPVIASATATGAGAYATPSGIADGQTLAWGAEVEWDANSTDAQCRALAANSTYSYDGKLDIIYIGGLATAQQSIVGSAVNVSAGSWDYVSDKGDEPWNATNVAACCIVGAKDYNSTGPKFRCIPSGDSVITLNVTIVTAVAQINETSSSAYPAGPTGVVSGPGAVPTNIVISDPTGGQGAPAPVPPPATGGYQQCPTNLPLIYSGYYEDGKTRRWGWTAPQQGADGKWWQVCANCPDGSVPRFTEEWRYGIC
ncbi:hypothetical protein M427DRAFT_31129 [Gonapodya prolifera JEL478]|uniref:Uncharacterized protein n=1 Tax=Gonapodya prolifera (strain JEL478) TaxID=1344416 RepID=A0A139AI03_GONPJ|nr:hypothetical protein M427DRAFT_31129 [Gonapodya prolifera JEL478]|eukprot:KXS16390.1 hypothetical protein M427DRAFT_31129 [Gonapodya prolifera JEL478]